MLDDIGTKVPDERLGDIEPTWRIETSPGNYQVGIALTEPLTDAAKATEVQQAFIEAGLCDPGAGGLNRWARFPNGINGKPKHLDANGQSISLSSGRLESRKALHRRATPRLIEGQARLWQESPQGLSGDSRRA